MISDRITGSAPASSPRCSTYTTCILPGGGGPAHRPAGIRTIDGIASTALQYRPKFSWNLMIFLDLYILGCCLSDSLSIWSCLCFMINLEERLNSNSPYNCVQFGRHRWMSTLNFSCCGKWKLRNLTVTVTHGRFKFKRTCAAVICLKERGSDHEILMASVGH